ncbi:hypothetical protein T12_6427 [Trichinella patagoniensis]|uniref:Uncharacterized protein n=1 Tax=Trichinella patagoniensis TaxID=990121 RepID=A0A0V0Z5K1_9BILA|nr:hypothetical protein T12_6427 [Trichinella patagoniensis]
MEKSTRISLQQNISDIELPSFLYDRCALSAFALTLHKLCIWYNHCQLSSSAGIKHIYIHFSFAGLDPSAKQLKPIQKLKSEKLTLSNHHSLYWLATAIRVCPIYIGSDGANKRFLHFYPSDLTVDWEHATAIKFF